MCILKITHRDFFFLKADDPRIFLRHFLSFGACESQGLLCSVPTLPLPSCVTSDKSVKAMNIPLFGNIIALYKNEMQCVSETGHF